MASLDKWIKNIHIAEIRVLGIGIPSGSYFKIPDQKMNAFSFEPKLEDFINTDKAVLSKDGIVDLNKADSLSFLKVLSNASQISIGIPGFSAKDLVELIKEAKNTAPGTGGLPYFQAHYGDQAPTNKWVEITANNFGNKTGFVFHFPCVMRSISVSNDNALAEFDVNFYKNGVTGAQLIFTWQIRGFKRKYKSNGLAALTFNQGDILHVKLADQGANAQYVELDLLFQATSVPLGEGGS